MVWKPMSEEKILEEINSAQDRMTAPQRRFWEAIRIRPEKWQQHPWGDAGGGFWVVAVMGQTVIWYNDIEEGFNLSRYSCYGEIGEYWCNQDNLEWIIQQLMNQVATGQLGGQRLGPPEPMA